MSCNLLNCNGQLPSHKLMKLLDRNDSHFVGHRFCAKQFLLQSTFRNLPKKNYSNNRGVTKCMVFMVGKPVQRAVLCQPNTLIDLPHDGI